MSLNNEDIVAHGHDSWSLEDIIALFDGVFTLHYQTRLVRGGDEPLYRPANAETPYHQIIFARGFYASALHEISHWCIAGAKRRQLEDYGYWYLPDGRNAQEQSAFEQAEIAPQALESLFADACERTFHVSVDNLGGDVEVDRDAFAGKVNARKQRYLQEGLPTRANALYVALTSFYQRKEPLAAAIAQGQAVLAQAPAPVNV
ncbi:elongation factor P hydroxylase [Vreelandella populi]|uniref:elongation factor P hydroxylase n=1 Tax=Vreelandella populi TaxID=2498858 RepID=UPI000F8D55EC|nr:elongation factor P hydroxylase [Halomonas populi]RUR55953.1 elongation factor P hydroxylase [Halomonas populi]